VSPDAWQQFMILNDKLDLRRFFLLLCPVNVNDTLCGGNGNSVLCLSVGKLVFTITTTRRTTRRITTKQSMVSRSLLLLLLLLLHILLMSWQMSLKTKKQD